MKKLLSSALVLAGMLFWTSCSDDANVTPSDEAAGKGKPQAGNYIVTSSLDGYTLSITIDQSGSQAVSHLLLQVTDCDGGYIDSNNVVSSSVPADYTTGNGTGCAFAGDLPFIKFDNLDIYQGQGSFTITITFNTQIKTGDILVKSGKACTPFALDFEDNCDTPPPPGGKTETAFAMGDPSACFLDLDLNSDGKGDFSRWGWTNGPIGEGSYEWPIYAGAGQCDTNKGTHVGTLSVDYSAGSATVTYTLFSGFTLDETHLYVGSGILPMTGGKNSKYTVAPGQYPNVGTSASYTVDGLSGDVYVVAHAVVGGF